MGTATRVDRLSFLETLRRVQPGIAARDGIEQGRCVVFRDRWAFTFNDEVACASKSPLPADLEGAVHAKTLIDSLESIPNDEVDVWVEKGQFRIRAGRTKVGVRMEADVVLPIDTVDEPAEWVDLDPNFARALEQVQGAVGMNEEEFLTVCIHLHPEWVEATDRLQASRCWIRTGVTRPFLVRQKSLAHILQLGMTRIGETDNWVHFRNKNIMFSCRRHLEEYPDISGSFAYRGTPTVLPRGGVDAAKLTEIFVRDEKDAKLFVELQPGLMVVTGEGAYGWAEESIEVAFKGDPVRFRIKPEMLRNIIHNHNECEIGPGRLRADGDIEGAKWVYLTVLGKADPRKEESTAVTKG